jgi:hypothetical protein
MLGLTSLSGWEDAVLASVRGATGTLEERDSQIERSGLYGEYPAIVSAYTEHFADGDSALEALKRAYFLVWRGAMAPPADSGIASLPDGTIRLVMDELGRVGPARSDRPRVALDARPLPCSWTFGARALWSERIADSSRRRRRRRRLARGEITPGSMAGRGQLGRYWTDLAAHR